MVFYLTNDPSDASRARRRLEASGLEADEHVVGSLHILVSASPRLFYVGIDDGRGLIVSGVPTGWRKPPAAIRSAEALVETFTTCEGHFAAIHVDGERDALRIVTDPIGLEPIYLRREGERFAVASVTRLFEADPCLAAWGAVIAMGHPIGDSTLVENVRRLPGGSVIDIEARSGRERSTPYWTIPDKGKPPSLDEIHDLFTASVDDLLELDQNPTIALSGGFDSRLIASELLSRGLTPSAVIVAHQDEPFDLDGRFAAQFARKNRLAFCICRPEDDFYSRREYLDFIRDCDAQFSSLGLFIARVPHFLTSPCYWDGCMTDSVLKQNVPADDGFSSVAERYAKKEHDPAWQAAAELFKRETVEQMRDGARMLFDRERSAYGNDSQGVYWFEMMNRKRNRIANTTVKAIGSVSRPLMAGLRRDFVVAGANMPYEEKKHYRLYLSFLDRFYPSALTTPLLSGGEVVASPHCRARSSAWSAAVAVAAQFERRPRLGRLTDRVFSPSRRMKASIWANGGTLWDEGDAHLRPEGRQVLDRGHPLQRQAISLLFHWRTWHLLHSGKLMASFQPLPERHGADHPDRQIIRLDRPFIDRPTKG